MSESYFARIVNEVLDASEKLTIRIEEGLNVVLSGGEEVPKTPGGTTPPPTTEHEFEGWDEDYADEESSPLAGMAESVMGDILSSQKGPETTWEHLDAFRYAITWSEPFIICLVVFQVVIFGLTIYVGRREGGLVPRVALMIFIGGLVRSAEWINQWASAEWKSFCTQNYFDDKGIFVAIFLCAPLLIDSFIMLVLFLRESALLLVQVKRAQIKNKSKSEKASRRGKKDQ